MAPSTPPHAARKRRVASPSSETDTPAHLPRNTTIADPNLREALNGQDLANVSSPQSTKILNLKGKDASLLGLPCELLELVASNLIGGAFITNLALANKHLHGIVRKTMVRDLVVSKKHIKSCIDMLARNPDLINCVASVDLSDFGCGHMLDCHQDCRCLGTPNFKPDVFALIGRTITSNSGSAITWTQIREAKYTRGTVWRKQQSFFLDVLLTLCPNIKSVTLELPAARRFDVGAPPRPMHLAPNTLPGLNPDLIPVIPFQGPALQIIRQRLETLTITEDTRWKGPATLEFLGREDLSWRNMGKHTVTLADFPKLKRLDIPMEVLGHPKTILFVDPIASAVAPGDSIMRTKVLPLTLQYLHLRSCNKWTFTLLQKINEVPMDQLSLKCIQLFFKAGPRDLLMRCDSTDEGRLNYLRVLSDLRRKGTKVIFYTGRKEEVLDMSKELASLSALSPFEAWHFSVSRMPFSALNPVASEKRRISETASRLFLRHAGNHLSLFNSSTLDLGLWAQGAFFHGIKNTKWDPDLIDRNRTTRIMLPGDSERRPLGKREGKRRLAALLNLNNFDFAFRADRNLAPLLKDISFLGKSLPIPSLRSDSLATRRSYWRLSKQGCGQFPLRRHPRSQIRLPLQRGNPMNKGALGADGVKNFEQGHWTKRVSQRQKNDQGKGLEDFMADLRLEPISSSPAAEVVFTKDTEFSAGSWVGVEWLALMHPKRDVQVPSMAK